MAHAQKSLIGARVQLDPERYSPSQGALWALVPSREGVVAVIAVRDPDTGRGHLWELPLRDVQLA